LGRLSHLPCGLRPPTRRLVVATGAASRSATMWDSSCHGFGVGHAPFRGFAVTRNERLRATGRSHRDGLRWTLPADVAQLVEHRLPKPRVVGSSPIVRSGKGPHTRAFFVRGDAPARQSLSADHAGFRASPERDAGSARLAHGLRAVRLAASTSSQGQRMSASSLSKVADSAIALVQRMNSVFLWLAWCVSAVVWPVVLGLVNHSDSLEGVLAVAVIGSGAVGLLTGFLTKHLLVSLSVCVPFSLIYVVAYVISWAAQVDDDEWNSADSGYLIGGLLFPVATAMLIGAGVGWLGQSSRADGSRRRRHFPSFRGIPILTWLARSCRLLSRRCSCSAPRRPQRRDTTPCSSWGTAQGRTATSTARDAPTPPPSPRSAGPDRRAPPRTSAGPRGPRPGSRSASRRCRPRARGRTSRGPRGTG
jgi:hypothetical protein